MIIARGLCREAKATLGLPVMNSDACDALSLQHQIQETCLKLLNKEIEQFIDIDHLDEEFATHMEYGDEITHVIIRLYSRTSFIRTPKG